MIESLKFVSGIAMVGVIVWAAMRLLGLSDRDTAVYLVPWVVVAACLVRRP